VFEDHLPRTRESRRQQASNLPEGYRMWGHEGAPDLSDKVKRFNCMKPFEKTSPARVLTTFGRVPGKSEREEGLSFGTAAKLQYSVRHEIWFAGG
jgi:hypothetical protein